MPGNVKRPGSSSCTAVRISNHKTERKREAVTRLLMISHPLGRCFWCVLHQATLGKPRELTSPHPAPHTEEIGGSGAPSPKLFLSSAGRMVSKEWCLGGKERDSILTSRRITLIPEQTKKLLPILLCQRFLHCACRLQDY